MKSLPDIIEWQSSNFATLGPFEVTVLAALFVLLSRGVRVPLVRLIVLLGLVHLALHETRHVMVLAVVGSLLLAEPIGRVLWESGKASRLPEMSSKVRILALSSLVVAFAGVAAARLSVPAMLTDSPTTPISALGHVPQGLRGQPVLNDYGMGGFLIFNQVRPFIDGRADMYGDDFVQRFMKIAKRDRAALTALLSRYGVRWTILAPENPAVAEMDSLPGWKRLYADGSAVVHVRTAP